MYQTKKSKYAREVVGLLRAAGCGVMVERGFYECAREVLGEANSLEIFEGGAFSADFAISLGGDGTFLRAAMYVGDKGIPILGINIGHLGFMSEVAPSEIANAIECLRTGRYRVEHRSVLEAVVADGDPVLGEYPYALNEIAFLKQDVSSMLKIHVSAAGDYLTTYSADGLVVATPTGSTGYSLSAGGPVLVPASRSLVISPVAPHSLSVRPIVIRDDVSLSVSVESRSGHFLVSVDGRSVSRSSGSSLTIRRAPFDICIAHVGSKTFFDTLREKLMWDGDLQK